jgi:hypothetical protein
VIFDRISCVIAKRKTRSINGVEGAWWETM